MEIRHISKGNLYQINLIKDFLIGGKEYRDVKLTLESIDSINLVLQRILSIRQPR